MKKITVIPLMIALCTAMACLSGCSSAPNGSVSAESTATEKTAADSGKLNIVCTTFPEYDWTRQILGDHIDSAQLSCLLDTGADIHSYQPTADDIVKISTCDMFIYVGGESDEWVRDVLEDAQNKDMRVISLMDALGADAKEEEIREGMQEHDHDHDEHDGDEHEEAHEHDDHKEDEETEYDEHIWLSLRNAETLCTVIEGELAAADPERAADYKANLDSYISGLRRLDGEFTALADGSTKKTLIFCDRFPFRYFTDDYGFDYYAAFSGCSADTEASFETVRFLADKVNELGCDTVFTIENSDQAVARTVAETSGRQLNIAQLDSMQSMTADEIYGSSTYLSVMQNNYDVLKNALE